MFRCKDRAPKDLVLEVVYKYTCGKCISSCYRETERHLKVRSVEHTPLTFKEIKPSKKSSTSDHLLKCVITLLLMILLS